MNSALPQHLAALLEAFFNDNTTSDRLGARLRYNIQQSHHRLTLCQKIVDNQHAVAWVEVLLGNLYIKGGAAGERGYLRGIQLSVQIFGLALLRKNDRRIIKVLCNHDRNTDARCLDGQNLVDALTVKTAAKLLSDLIQQTNIHLMIQKAVHLQHIALFYVAILQDSLFQ